MLRRSPARKRFLAEDVAQTVGGGQRASAVMVAQLMFT